ncbi:MAG: AAA family ATPase, partial [Candidatus Eremiobacteraeota bacterium]|nr:AAA family ATPase [Candidatus Eremiobacteraeota bacterium]
MRRSAAAQSHGCLVLIEGEAGIGKSRLVNAFRETLTNGRASVGLAACREFGNAPYGPIAEALAVAGIRVNPATAPTYAEQLRDLRSRVEEACRRRNCVLILEDIQWADEGTLAFLHYLLPYVGSMRLLVVATLRTDDIIERAVPYLTRLARDRGSFRVALTALSPLQTRRLIRLALGDRVLSGGKVEEIVRRAEGNPFFAEELLSAALEATTTSPAAAEVLPRTIRAVVAERIARLDAPTIEIAMRAAVLGPRFEAAFLAQTFGYALPDVLSALRRLRDLGLMVEMPTQPPTYCFRHTLTRDAIYTGMLTGEARALHARILQELERRQECSLQDLGYHAWEARDGAKCLDYNERAGDQAEAAYAHADAVHCYERALQGDCDAEAKARLLIKAAVSASRDGMAERSVQFFDVAASTLKGHGSAEQI